ncbi:[FeFe] hydrogenase H-cluster maturation GTPase HydF [Lentisphaerota bacterium ZTH]|nr:[FeFe] hydrogenase H-cluster maturation GTPase HydF [Lentisphaerota bacterium]WET07581.1 [FeFe] hydrogenase H-cluster maturation GTPase HydF [Lentisphaerota bacterium ZTH]
MQKTPKSLRLQIAIFGRTNVGKSSFLNYISGQDVAITSPIPGTTTDVVEKPMELLPIGPVVFIDTAGLDDTSKLGEERIKKARKAFDRADIVTIICEPGQWGKAEEEIVAEARRRNIAVVNVINKVDIVLPEPEFKEKLAAAGKVIECACTRTEQRESVRGAYKAALIENCPDDYITPPPLVSDLLTSGDTCLLIVPIDLQAPKSRLILPQVHTIRDTLDSDCASIVVKETDYLKMLAGLKNPPDLVICDSQVVDRMVRETPPEVSCTTFSILFSRLKGDMEQFARGTAAIDNLKSGDKVLIAEACSHHATKDDIGRVKIPKWLRDYLGYELDIEVYAGRDYPENLNEFNLVIHCGSCMLNRRETLARLQKAQEAGVPVTNYGMCISYTQGVLERVLSPFPKALAAFKEVISK